MNWFYKLLGYVECKKCKIIFKKSESGSIGIMWNEEKQKHENFNMCKNCSNKFLKLAFNNKNENINPLKKFMEDE
jgi:hypothetical protein